MPKMILRLVAADGEIRRQEAAVFPSTSAIWVALADIAQELGRPGEFLQVFDDRGEMIIRVGVATAQSAASPSRKSA